MTSTVSKDAEDLKFYQETEIAMKKLTLQLFA